MKNIYYVIIVIFLILSSCKQKENSADKLYNKTTLPTEEVNDQTNEYCNPSYAYETSDYTQMNCKSCHYYDRKLVGPALKNSFENVSVNWLMAFINNPDSLLKSKDTLTNAIFEKNPNSKHFEKNAFMKLDNKTARQLLNK